MRFILYFYNHQFTKLCTMYWMYPQYTPYVKISFAKHLLIIIHFNNWNFQRATYSFRLRNDSSWAIILQKYNMRMQNQMTSTWEPKMNGWMVVEFHVLRSYRSRQVESKHQVHNFRTYHPEYVKEEIHPTTKSEIKTQQIAGLGSKSAVPGIHFYSTQGRFTMILNLLLLSFAFID